MWPWIRVTMGGVDDRSRGQSWRGGSFRDGPGGGGGFGASGSGASGSLSPLMPTGPFSGFSPGWRRRSNSSADSQRSAAMRKESSTPLSSRR